VITTSAKTRPAAEQRANSQRVRPTRSSGRRNRSHGRAVADDGAGIASGSSVGTVLLGVGGALPVVALDGLEDDNRPNGLTTLLDAVTVRERVTSYTSAPS